MRALLPLVLALAWLLPIGARADVLPSPARPEWEHTPLPMPTGPPEDAVAAVGLVIAAAAWVATRRRTGA